MPSQNDINQIRATKSGRKSTQTTHYGFQTIIQRFYEIDMANCTSQ
jgi:hypothetical protein